MEKSNRFRIKKNTENVDWERVTQILNGYGLSSFDVATERKVFENSYAVVFLYDAHRLIGMARAISDGICQAACYNLALDPEYCGQGLGKMVLDALLEQLEGMNVILYTSPKWYGLYEHWGLKRMKTGYARYVDEAFMAENGFI